MTPGKVYPRVCGGTRCPLPFPLRREGLSPRVRGNLPVPRPSPGSWRSIPACAGEPRKGTNDGHSAKVYPRVCGGTAQSAQRGGTGAGLSPRVRGNQPSDPCVGHRSRSIPACAGEPAAQEKAVAEAHRREVGLSPRVRGNLHWEGCAHSVRGSIPACAGEPRQPSAGRAPATVYPRVCGGTAARKDMYRTALGLSPRVRGNRDRVRSLYAGGRSIPACAGEPRCWTAGHAAPRVYPRVCGGTSQRGIADYLVSGLSPRVRGNPAFNPGCQRIIRSIPACAGEPKKAKPKPPATKVYPRVCGGTPYDPNPTERRDGLSPRVRGNLIQPPQPRQHSRSIPACAGEPRCG